MLCIFYLSTIKVGSYKHSCIFFFTEFFRPLRQCLPYNTLNSKGCPQSVEIYFRLYDWTPHLDSIYAVISAKLRRTFPNSTSPLCLARAAIQLVSWNLRTAPDELSILIKILLSSSDLYLPVNIRNIANTFL